MMVDSNSNPIGGFMADLIGEPAYTLREAAGLLGVHYEAVRTWVRSGRLASFRLGGRDRIRRSELLRFTGQAAQAGQPANQNTPPRYATSDAIRMQRMRERLGV